MYFLAVIKSKYHHTNPNQGVKIKGSEYFTNKVTLGLVKVIFYQRVAAVLFSNVMKDATCQKPPHPEIILILLTLTGFVQRILKNVFLLSQRPMCPLNYEIDIMPLQQAISM